MTPFDRQKAGLKVYHFLTRRSGRERTRGILATVGAGDPPALAWTGAMAQELTESFPSPSPAEGVAHGKVAIVEVRPDSSVSTGAVFQSANGRSGRVDCGNASAAIATLLASGARADTISFAIWGSSAAAPTMVDATCISDQIQQTWTVPAKPRVLVSSVCGQRVISVDGLFNRYMVVDAGFDHASVDILRHDVDSRARIVALDLGADTPSATFFTCGRPHPSAPLTGLAVLAFLVQEIRWLKRIATSRTVFVNGLPEPLPTIIVRPTEVEINLPETAVEIESHSTTMLQQERAA